MRTSLAAVLCILILAVFSPPVAAQSASPIYVFLLEGNGTSTGTIHVFSVTAQAGALIEVPGSPFNAGLMPEQLVVDPTGRFVYVINEQSEDITEFSVNASSGVLTELPGSPFSIGITPVTMTVDPTGRFLYVFANGSVNGVSGEYLYEFTVDPVAGVLTSASSSPTLFDFGKGILVTSIAFNPLGNFAYLGQVYNGPVVTPILICAVDFNTGVLSQGIPGQCGSVKPSSGEADNLAVSPNNNFLFSIDNPFSAADAYTINPGSGLPTEISGSPYPLGNLPVSVVVHPTGNFLYVVNRNAIYQTNETPSQYDGSIYAFAINSGTGALKAVTGSPFAAGINPNSIVVDPTGSFAFTTSTKYTTGYTGFAQILEFSINPATGVLTPLFGSTWTDVTQSNGEGLAISTPAPGTANPVPSISSLFPPSATATGIAFTLQVNGANFVPGATVYFEGQPRTTTFVNSTQLNANILGSDIQNGGSAIVFVFNPLPGGGASTSVEFAVSNPAPVISSLKPSSVAAGTAGFSIVVLGSNFVSSSVVNFNGVALSTAFIGSTSLVAQVPVADLPSPGTANITVTNPSNGVSGGGTSNAVILTIEPPVTQPVVSNISPTSANAGGPAFNLTVNGSGFVQGSIVSFNLISMTTTFVNSGQLTAAIPASAIAIAVNPDVIVMNPDGFASEPVTFTVNGNPQPGVGKVSPGSNALTLNVAGSGFVQGPPGSMVFVNENSRVTTFMSSTLLQTTLMPSDLAQGGTLVITVMNPPPGGGTSPAVSFAAADYSVTGPVSPTMITAGLPATIVLTVSPTNGAFSYPVTFSVSNPPPDSSPAFSPSATITPGAAAQQVTLSISTTAHSAVSTLLFLDVSRPSLPMLGMAFLVFALAGIWFIVFGSRTPRFASQVFLGLLLAPAAAMIACGAVGSGPSAPAQVNPATGTPAGTYQVTVLASSGGVTHSTTVTLTVM